MEDDAKASTATHPFTDVPGWADRYIAFAYENGLTKGGQIPAGTDDADSDMYRPLCSGRLGTVIRTAIRLNTPDTLAKAVGILPDSVNTSKFMRSDAVLSHGLRWELILRAAAKALPTN